MESGDLPSSVRCVLLVGLMGSGKTTVGRLLATRIGWDFHDLDEVIEARSGSTIPEIFRDRGEAAFRALEEEVGWKLLKRERVVVASGGGWPCRPGRMEGLAPETLSVWLKVSPGIAARRVGEGGGGRPLLAGGDPEERARALLGERTPYYDRAALHLDTEARAPEELADTLAQVIRERSGEETDSAKRGYSTDG